MIVSRALGSISLHTPPFPCAVFPDPRHELTTPPGKLAAALSKCQFHRRARFIVCLASQSRSILLDPDIQSQTVSTAFCIRNDIQWLASVIKTLLAWQNNICLCQTFRFGERPGNGHSGSKSVTDSGGFVWVHSGGVSAARHNSVGV
ncbi:hypothetical protein CY34DRAFT_245140 [Suillus luteus UH-Slu-Lm8-n1]|uniref:Uncharacterized protein n=1 Tax=Suillus luteus UH-Slu-Lm8-n1 TaxID=930992 RepID=A0A0C9ZSN1_9AGAM|nr:hypothetical protein CY34DRAFT_245140 [Suillus luteus UH-Slu-Lm8-n1]